MKYIVREANGLYLITRNAIFEWTTVKEVADTYETLDDLPRMIDYGTLWVEGCETLVLENPTGNMEDVFYSNLDWPEDDTIHARVYIY